MKVAYIRVSSQDQNEQRQLEMMKENGIEKYYSEKISGATKDRPKLIEMLSFVREGDTIYIESFSRLARNTMDLLSIVKELSNKGVALVSLKERIDTASPQGKLMLTIFAALSEFERDIIKERQSEGIAVARMNNKQLGRPKIEITDKFKKSYTQWKNGSITAVKAMELSNLTKPTFYRLVKEYEKK
ncbi:recombinase family protein [Paenibacillus agricola]|uniref:Recombinase family protein n=1 Tax=Paenibacillus agricola TaxID=2716264 RepID=A0ABX0JDP9_9BACL|nr:recombinase family protein [Paenibacillus agricola]NHN34625.1 recombinase family protein [Paenibacillus agricola]